MEEKAASAIILQEKKILLVKRSEHTELFPNYWACPGGRIKGDETLEEAAIREVKEEVNLYFQPTKLFAQGQYQNRELYRYIGNWKGEVKLQEEELSDWNWFTYEEALKLNLAFDYRKIIEDLHRKELL